MKTKQLKIKRTISNARDTQGWNIVTLSDGKQTFRTLGGGYDMLGTVLGKWIQKNYMERLKELKPYDSKYSMEFYQEHGYQPMQENYGLFDSQGKLYMDGACGIESMIDIAKKIGLSITRLYDREYKNTTGFNIVDERE